MTTRRRFMRTAAAGLVFCGCQFTARGHAQQGNSSRLPVTVGGKRVKTIDVHAHCLFREATALIGDAARALTPPIRDAQARPRERERT